MPRERTLPIFDLEIDLAAAMNRERARAVVEAPTGSGKSTQIPQFLRDSGRIGDGEILVLQPRRLAARMLASRVASERDEPLGEEVGYQVRFESATSSRTRIRFVTEGILIRMLIEDPELSGVGAVVLDEFHERHFFGDISLARCLEVQETVRPDLRIVVMSATIEARSLLDYLGDECSHLVSDGRTFPVEIEYRPPRERHKGQLWDHIARGIRDHLKEKGVEGNILVFLPGRYEIQKTSQNLRKAAWASGFEVHELYGELSPSRQDAAVRPGGRPRIVVATNVAETSITIPEVRLVVDSGLERRSAFDHRRGITTLHIEKISAASADQRAGRAGRTAPGTAIRLWSPQDQESREHSSPPEIHRMDLTEAVLILASSGVEAVREFRWFEAPDPSGLEEAIERLQVLGALDESESLTEMGRRISRLPVAPRYGRTIHEGARVGCLETAALVAALAQGRPLFPARKRQPDHLSAGDFANPEDVSDFEALIRAYSQMKENGFRREVGERLGIHAGAAREIERIARQITRIASSWPVERENPGQGTSHEVFARTLLTGFSDRLALRDNTSTLSCSVVGNRRGQINRDSIAADSSSRLFVASEIVEIEGKDLSVKLSLCTRIEPTWLEEMFPADYQRSEGVFYDERFRKIEARRETRFRDLVLESRPGGEIHEGHAASVLARKVHEGELVLKKWDDKIESWIVRLNLAAEHCPEYGLPPIDDEARLLLLEQICAGATSYKQIKDRPVKPALHDWVPGHLRSAMDHLAPETLRLSNGTEPRVLYRPEEKPRISILIQKIFGLGDRPTVCEGRVPVIFEILGPNHRPVQVTEDLASFWTGSYPAVRAQLRGRYPKHEWPEFD